MRRPAVCKTAGHDTLLLKRKSRMSKLLRGLAAGYGAKKLGGGCFSTILVFALLWALLGQCDGFR